MKKQKKFAELAGEQLVIKHLELVKELAKFRLTLDTSSIGTTGGLAVLRRDIKLLARKIAVSKGK
jgi:ribosomal protein L29